MTVAELIELLNTTPSNAKVLVNSSDVPFVVKDVSVENVKIEHGLLLTNENEPVSVVIG